MDSENNANKDPQTPLTPTKVQEKNTLMAILSYIGPLVIISYATSKDDPFVKYHIKQGLVLFAIEVGLWVLSMVLWILWPLINIAQIILLVLSIIGIINVLGGKEKELPLVGKYASHWKI